MALRQQFIITEKTVHCKPAKKRSDGRGSKGRVPEAASEPACREPHVTSDNIYYVSLGGCRPLPAADPPTASAVTNNLIPLSTGFLQRDHPNISYVLRGADASGCICIREVRLFAAEEPPAGLPASGRVNYINYCFWLMKYAGKPRTTKRSPEEPGTRHTTSPQGAKQDPEAKVVTPLRG